MLEELELTPIFTDINPITKTISIAKDTIVKKDGIEIARNRHRRAFAPGDIEKVKEYLGIDTSPEIIYLESIWTQEVIDNYLNSIENI